MGGLIEVTSPQELRELVGAVMPRAATKVRTTLHQHDRDWLASSPFCLIATSDSRGNLDVSPKGDPAGFVHVIDDATIAIPERPGNRRVDGYLNVLENPHVGLLSLIPGRSDTLRINGRATVVRDAPFFDSMIVKGHRPILALVVKVEEIFFHCPKAFMRSQLWEPETWQPEAMPSRVLLMKETQAIEETIEELEAQYGAKYAAGLYLQK